MQRHGITKDIKTIINMNVFKASLLLEDITRILFPS